MNERVKEMHRLISNEEILDRLNWRRAVKKFDNTAKIDSEDWKMIEDALVLSPSSYGLQPWKFYVVTDDNVRKELVDHSWGQTQVVDCSHLVVIAAKKDVGKEEVERYASLIKELRGDSDEALEASKASMLGSINGAKESGFINEWSARQCFIALGFLLSAAAMGGIDTCPMEGFVASEYDRILGIDDDGYFSVVVCAAGYRDATDESLSKKIRYPKEDVTKWI